MQVELKQAPDGIAVTVDDVVLHTAGSESEAAQLAQWVQYQLREGHSVDEVQRLLSGQPAADDEADFTVLEGTVSSLQKALATGAHDGSLDALLAAEAGGKKRRGALAALRKRLEDR